MVRPELREKYPHIFEQGCYACGGHGEPFKLELVDMGPEEHYLCYGCRASLVKGRDWFYLPFSQRGVFLQKPPPEAPPPDHIALSVVSPIWDRGVWPPLSDESVIQAMVESIVDQKYPAGAWELIMVDDASDDESFDIITEMCETYPDFNLRGYRLLESRTYSAANPLNVGMKRALGEIVIISQPDLVWVSEDFFDLTYRHHQLNPDLFLCAEVYSEQAEWDDLIEPMIERHDWFNIIEECDPPIKFCGAWPHNDGASLRKYHVEATRGWDERYIYGVSDLNWFCRLTRVNVVFGKEERLKVLHRAISKGGHKWSRGAELDVHVPWDIDKPVNPQGWGTLTPEEKKLTVMSKKMKRVMKHNG